MSFKEVEKAVWKEAKVVFNNPKLRLKDILEWSTGNPKPETDKEVVAKLPDIGVSVCVLKVHDKRKLIES